MPSPKYHHRVYYPTEDVRTLDLCYTTIKHIYSSISHFRFGRFDHLLVLFLLAYRQIEV